MKTKQRRGADDAPGQFSQRLNVRITPTAYERLLIHGIKCRKSPGELVTELISKHLRGWAMPAPIVDRSVKHDRVIPADSVIEMPAENAA